MKTWLAIGVAMLACGCARNAILELDVELPPTGATRAELLVLSDPPPSYDDPRWASVTPEPLDELGDVARVQVVAGGPAVEAPLAIRVRLCDAAPCPEPSPEVRVEVERAFYAGHHTWLTISVPAVPNDVSVVAVDPCSVGGCLGGETLDFCRLDGTHYCE